MDINTAEYIGSWQKNADMPHTELPEFAFIGRSNVGKSSLINMLTQRNGLAKTSSTPGKTQSINLFLLNKKIQFVDLPGYGYAKLSKDKREIFGKMMKHYLHERVNMYCLFVLIDLRIKPQQIDMDFINECGEHDIPMALIGTKADKLKPAELEANKAAIDAKLLEFWNELPPFFISSAETKVGRDEVWNFIKGTCKQNIMKFTVLKIAEFDFCFYAKT
jgi:GTP-binding protein